MPDFYVLAASAALAGLIILATHHAKAFLAEPRPARISKRKAWKPRTSDERSVYAALFIAGKPCSNRELADLMCVSPGEASKRLAAINGQHIVKKRIGREVQISLA